MAASPTTDDTHIVKNIADKFGIDLELSDVVRTFRVRRDPASTDTRPPLLNVEFVSERVKKKFVQPDIRTKIEALVSDDSFKGVLMYPDSTWAQRQEYRVLKAQAQAKNDLLRREGDTENTWIVSRIRGVVKVKKRHS